MKHLYFMRHGLSLHNQIGIFSGRTDSPLVDEGKEDVKKSAESVKYIGIDVIVCSPLQRAVESAEIIAEVIGYKGKILENDLLSERDFGALEGTPYIPLKVKDDVEDIESVEDLVKRAQRALKWIESLHADEVLVVSHGSLGRSLRYVISEEIPFNHPVKFGNAEIVQLK